MLLTIVPRLTRALTLDSRSLPCGPESWGSTQVVLPSWAGARRFRHLLTGAVIEPAGSRLSVVEVFRTIPVGWLWAPKG
jgi:maltooligosyltrehalose synthase